METTILSIKSSDIIDLWKATECVGFEGDNCYKKHYTEIDQYLTIVIRAKHLFSNIYYPVGNHLQKLEDLKEALIKMQKYHGDLNYFS
mgnify:CR=1 FL=1